MQILEMPTMVKTDTSLLNPTTLDIPAYLMSVPFSYSALEANNIWMKEIKDEERKVNTQKALKQFWNLYNYMASNALVSILPSPANCQLQDLVFTANLGIVLEHLPNKNTVVISNYTSEPRVGETQMGVNFFQSMGYDVYVSPYKFEGEAELKHLYNNVYVGGYGIRSDKKTYDWMEKEFDMKIIKLKEVDDYLYHLDCTIFPINKENTLVGTELLTKKEIKELEKYTNIIDVAADECYSGITNSVRIHNSILNASNIHELKAGTEDYKCEIQKNRKLEDIAVELGFEVFYFNLDEYFKGGALLSCMVMHLNRRSYEVDLL